MSQVVVGAVALIDPSCRVLLGQRPLGGQLPNLWEFPGGKKRIGETVKMAARREMLEELGVTIRADKLVPFDVVSYPYETFELCLHLFVCSIWKGDPSPKVHSRIRWVPLRMLESYAMPPADAPLITKLLLAFP